MLSARRPGWVVRGLGRAFLYLSLSIYLAACQSCAQRGADSCELDSDGMALALNKTGAAPLLQMRLGATAVAPTNTNANTNVTTFTSRTRSSATARAKAAKINIRFAQQMLHGTDIGWSSSETSLLERRARDPRVRSYY